MLSKPLINERFFDQPGFNELFNVWTEIFDAGSDFDPKVGLQKVHDVRDSLVAQNVIRTPDMNVLEGIACRYARRIGELALAEAKDELYV